MGVGDVNGDGRQDILEKNGWYEQPKPGEKAEFWTFHKVPFAEAGGAQMADAVNEFLVRKQGDVHEVLITHNFVISWFVREVLGAPEWRWMTLNQAHCGLTVIAQKQGRPWTLLTHNDLGHLPVELRTGLPDAVPV